MGLNISWFKEFTRLSNLKYLRWYIPKDLEDILLVRGRPRDDGYNLPYKIVLAFRRAYAKADKEPILEIGIVDRATDEPNLLGPSAWDEGQEQFTSIMTEVTINHKFYLNRILFNL